MVWELAEMRMTRPARHLWMLAQHVHNDLLLWGHDKFPAAEISNRHILFGTYAGVI